MPTRDADNHKGLPPEARRHLEEAYDLEDQGVTEDALRACEAALSLAPGWAEAHTLRGTLLDDLGRADEAAAAYREAVRLDGTLEEARENLRAIERDQAARAAPEGVDAVPDERIMRSVGQLAQDQRRTYAIRLGVSALLLIVGLAWVILEAGAAERVTLFFSIPASWFFLAMGVLAVAVNLALPARSRAMQQVTATAGGIRSGSQFMPWSEIATVYIAGMRTSTNWMPSGETRTLVLCTHDLQEMRIEILSLFRIGGVANRAFADLYQGVLSHISARQWDEFVAAYNRGQLILFGSVGVRQDGLFFPGYQGGKQPLPFAQVADYDIDRGLVRLDYKDERGRRAESILGSLDSLPNAHLFTAFLDQVVLAGRTASRR